MTTEPESHQHGRRRAGVRPRRTPRAARDRRRAEAVLQHHRRSRGTDAAAHHGVGVPARALAGRVLSTARRPRLLRRALRQSRCRPLHTSAWGRYGLEDIANDAVGLLDALRIDSAHVVGASLGGMVAQLMAIHHPSRVRSLASLMSTTGRRGKGKTALWVYRHMFSRRPRDEEAAIERRTRVFLDIGSTGFAQEARRRRRRSRARAWS